jgi:hypothetical protein
MPYGVGAAMSDAAGEGTNIKTLRGVFYFLYCV